MIEFIFNNFWEILISFCAFVSIIYPTIQGKVCGLIFCFVAIAPEFFDFEGLFYFPICILFALFGIILIHAIQPYSKYSFSICCLLFIEIIMNIIGMVIWFLDVSRNISQIFLESYNIFISPVFIYETSFIVFYFISIFVLFDWRNRKNAVGYRVFDFIGDFILSPFIRFKVIKRWME